jgi:tetratricopeptide (TPR) repeat protein
MTQLRILQDIHKIVGGIKNIGKQATNSWPVSDDTHNHKLYQSNIDRVFDPRVRRAHKHNLDKLKIEQKRDRERLKVQQWLYDSLYENLNFRAEVEKVKSDLGIKIEFDVRNIHFLGKDGLAQEREVKRRLNDLQNKYLTQDYLTCREYSLHLAEVDLGIATDFYNLAFYVESWYFLSKVHYFLRSQSGYKSEEITEYLKASYHIMLLLWKTRQVQFNLLSLQDLAYYCIENNLIYEAISILHDILKIETSSLTDVGWAWSMLGRAKSSLPRPDSLEISSIFNKSLECNSKIRDPLVRLYKESEIHTNQGIAYFNCGLLHEAEQSLESARENMSQVMELTPEYWSQEVYDQKVAEISYSQAYITIERLRSTGRLQVGEYEHTLESLKNTVYVFERLKSFEWQALAFEMCQSFSVLCEKYHPLFSLKIKSFLGNSHIESANQYTSPELARLNYSM